MSDKTVVLRDTKITIEIEAIPLPEGVLQERNLDATEGLDSNDKLFPYRIETRLKVGDRQIGVVSQMSLAAEMNTPIPLLIVDLLGGAKPLSFELTPALRESLQVSAAALRQFPFVQVNVPVQPII